MRPPSAATVSSRHCSACWQQWQTKDPCAGAVRGRCNLASWQLTSTLMFAEPQTPKADP